MSDKEMKEAVLAKCGEICPDLNIHVFSDNRIEQRANGYSMWDLTMSIVLYVSEDTPADSFVWPIAAKILGIGEKPKSVPFFESQLHELCVTLGWQGGTYHQVLEEIRRLKAADGKPKEARPSNDLLWEAFLLGEKIGSQPPSLVRDAVFEEWLATLPPDPLEADRKVLREAYGKVASPYFYRGDSKRFFDSYKRLAGMEVKNG